MIISFVKLTLILRNFYRDFLVKWISWDSGAGFGSYSADLGYTKW